MKPNLPSRPIWLVFFVLLSFTFVQAIGQATVTGKIVDETNKPLPGVSVVVKGKTTGSISNVEGVFSVLADENAILVFSAISYVTQEVAVNKRSTLSVSMQPSNKLLNEIVVVGYGTQSKRAVTGAVTSIGYDQFKDRSFSNVTQALAGSLPGVNITQAQGAPGVTPIIRIRGISSITAGTNPLFVVDGVPLENFNLNMINPQDIQSVEVLKDASSAAIYGSRGASGVIIVTTKLGKPGKSTVSASYEYGVQEVSRRVNMMNAQDWIKYYIDAKNNAWIDLGGNRAAADNNDLRPGTTYDIPTDFTTNPGQFGTGTDWQDVMFRVAPSRNAQVSVSGGTEKTQFLFSGALLKQDAVLDQNYYNRLALRSNVKHKLSDKFTIGLNVAVTGIVERTEGTEGKSDVISLGLQSDPIFPVYNELGTLGFRDPASVWNRFISYGDMNLWHPYSLTRFIDKKNRTFNTLAASFIEYEIIDGLSFRTSISGNLGNAKGDSYAYKNLGFGYSSLPNATASTSSSLMLNWLSENTLTYDKRIGDHGFNLLLGYTTQKQRDEFSTATATGFPNDLVTTLNAGTTYSGVRSLATEWSMISYLSRLNYNFKNKYFLSAAIRRDGSSRFGDNNKWGYFPSASVGWVMSDENFMTNFKTIDLLKLRASIGVAGNNQIPNYGSVGLLGASNANYAGGSTLLNGQTVLNIANTDLRWEKTTQFNIGVDLRMFTGRLTLAAEFYNSTTKDMLLNVPIPDITGFSTQLTNIGKMENKGIELNLSTKNIVGDFNWTTDFNFSRNRNKVLQLGPGNAPIVYTDFVVAVKTEVGQPVSNFYGYVFDGVFKNQAEIDKAPHDATTKPGDPIVRDVNGDGKITPDDRTTIGNYQPNFMAGLTNTLSYKGFELSFMFQGSFGGEITNQNVRYLGWWNNGRNMFADVNNRWKSESDPGDGKHFRADLANTGLKSQYSSYWVEDASFIRLKNVRISYTLPAKLLAKTPFKNTRIYMNAENVYLFSKYTNYDPENTTYNASNFSAFNNGLNASGNAPNGAFIGVDYGSYPLPRVISFGLKTDF